jgi:hypothetical protein
MRDSSPSAATSNNLKNKLSITDFPKIDQVSSMNIQYRSTAKAIARLEEDE